MAQTATAPAQPPDTDQHSVPVPAVTLGLLSGDEVPDSDTVNWSALRPIVPAMIGGYGASLAFGTEMERSNYIRGGLTGQATYDDNAYLTSTGPLSNYTYSIAPQISLDQSRSRVRWIMNYAGGFTFNQRFASQNQTSQDFNFDVQYRLSPHVNVRASEVILLTSGLFGATNGLDGTVPGVPQGNNPFVITPLSKEFQNITRGEISYQFTATDVIGMSGGYLGSQYHDQPVNTTLLDTQSGNAAGFYLHRLTPSNWVGGSYVYQQYAFSPGANDTVVHSALAFDTFLLRRDMTLSIFAGPQYSNSVFSSISGPPVMATDHGWSGAGGITYDWQGLHTSANASFVRHISDGGGVQGTVIATSVSGNFRRQLTRRWSVLLSGAYAINDGLAPSSEFPAASTKYASGGFAITHQFTEHLFCQAAYSRQYQESAGVTALNGTANHNVVLASVTYQFARPWGR